MKNSFVDVERQEKEHSIYGEIACTRIKKMVENNAFALGSTKRCVFLSCVDTSAGICAFGNTCM